MTKKLFINWLKVFGIGLVSSMFPFAFLGLLMGFMHILIASVIVIFVFRKELS